MCPISYFYETYAFLVLIEHISFVKNDTFAHENVITLKL